MMTPQDLKEQEFVKAVFGGYDISSVDEFFEQMSEDYASLFKENAVLKSKLKVLVEKVEEYRSTEDSMRMALLTAQKMGNEIVDEANKKSESIISEAQERADRQLSQMKEKIAVEERRLREATANTSEYCKNILNLYKGQVDYIKKLTELIVPEDLEATIESIPEIHENNLPEKEVTIEPKTEGVVEQVLNKESEKLDNESKQDEKQDDKNDIARSISESLGDTKRLNIDTQAEWDDEDEPTTKRPSFDFDNLQFGSKFGEKD